MVKSPLVSIVTPSYNQGMFLEETIKSVLEQSYPNIEYIIIDGGSKDRSQEIIKKYEDRLAYWESQYDRGQAHAINKGIKRAQGDILGWINSDDLYLPDTVERIVDVFDKNPEIDVIYGRLERIDESGKVIPTPTLPKDRVEFSKSLVIGECVVNQPGSFWRRRVMDLVGLLDESLKYGLDYEYWIRMAMADARFMRINDTVAQFRLSKSSKTVDQSAKMAEEQLAILDRLLLQENLSEILDVTETQINNDARKAKSIASLYAFKGYLKQKKYNKARSFFLNALCMYPFVIFDRRWYDLAIASLARRLKID
jgi:glycosyltransferase involved in cell wall biosynthesis